MPVNFVFVIGADSKKYGIFQNLGDKRSIEIIKKLFAKTI